MPFVPFAATVGTALGTSAAVGGAVVAGTVAKVGMDIAAGQQAKKAAKKASQDVSTQNAAAIQNLKDSQANASTQAQAAIDARRRAASQTIFTSPLGVTQQASVAKKQLLGQ